MHLHNVHPPFCWREGREGCVSYQIFKNGGLTGSQFEFSEHGGERGCRFYIKNKLKSGILNDKKRKKETANQNVYLP